jgi:UDP-N-acetylglucosamine acyltransferase
MDALFAGYDSQVDRHGLASTRQVVIHPTAQVAKGAELGTGCVIGPGALVGPKVVLGDRVKIGAGAILEGRTKVGDETTIFPYASVGSVPQDLKYRGEDTELLIGKRNRIREYVNISLGTEGGGGKTVIGDDNLIMVYTHIGHDCIIQSHCIFANGAQIAGHVEVGNYAVFGGLSGAHQFSRYGDMVMVAAGSMCSQDVPPFCMVHGDHASINGLNVVGLRRSGLKNISDIKAMYRIVYSENLGLDAAVEKILNEVPESAERLSFTAFLKASARGICR